LRPCSNRRDSRCPEGRRGKRDRLRARQIAAAIRADGRRDNLANRGSRASKGSHGNLDNKANRANRDSRVRRGNNATRASRGRKLRIPMRSCLSTAMSRVRPDSRDNVRMASMADVRAARVALDPRVIPVKAWGKDNGKDRVRDKVRARALAEASVRRGLAPTSTTSNLTATPTRRRSREIAWASREGRVAGSAEARRGRAGSPTGATAADRVAAPEVARAMVSFAARDRAKVEAMARAATDRRAVRPTATSRRAKRTAIGRRERKRTATSPCAIRWCRTTTTIEIRFR